jgi:hypothetical protein
MSYSTTDSQFANQLAKDLRDAGIMVWKAPDSILPGEAWVRAIQRGLTTSSYFLLIMSPNAVVSQWVNFEFEVALRHYHQEKMIILPIDYLPCIAPSFWQSFQHISMQSNYADGLSKLLQLFRVIQPPNPPSPVDPDTTIINLPSNGSINNSQHPSYVNNDPDAGRPPFPSQQVHRNILQAEMDELVGQRTYLESQISMTEHRLHIRHWGYYGSERINYFDAQAHLMKYKKEIEVNERKIEDLWELIKQLDNNN